MILLLSSSRLPADLVGLIKPWYFYNYDPSYQSPLREAMNKFRSDMLDPKQRIITPVDVTLLREQYQSLMEEKQLVLYG